MLAGERTDPKTVWWVRKNFPEVIFNDTYWSTECGWPVGSNMLNEKFYGPVFPTLPGSATKVTPGWNLRILNEGGEECNRNQLGSVCLKLPLPPSHASTIWGNDDRYI
mgnify:CR=1 FL=1|jgi:propionyl-CoA synthetase